MTVTVTQKKKLVSNPPKTKIKNPTKTLSQKRKKKSHNIHKQGTQNHLWIHKYTQIHTNTHKYKIQPHTNTHKCQREAKN